MISRVLLIGLTLPIAVPSAAMAQAGEDAAASSAVPDNDQIIVTARRRAEGIERVPASITAFGSSQILERGLRTEEDLQAATPGLVLRQTQGQNQLNYSIRGQTVDAFTGSAPSVVPYINDVQLTGGGSSSFFDLDSIQVLKGPQGTLFGRNATGGAVLYGTAKPTNEFGGYGQIAVGNYDSFESQGALNLPIVDDRVLLRVAFSLARRDGYQRNTYYDKMIGALNNMNGRASLTLKPADGFENTTVFEYSRQRGSNISLKPFSVYTRGQTGPDGTPLNSDATNFYNPVGFDAIYGAGAWAQYIAANPNIVKAHPNALAEGLPGYLAYLKTQPFWTAGTDEASQHRAHGYYLTNTTSYELSSALTIKNIFGLTYTNALDQQPQQGHPYGAQYTANLNLQQFGNHVTTRSVSDELQLQGKALDDALTYIIGGYYQHQRQHIFYPQTYYNAFPLPGVNGPYGFGNTSDYRNGDTSKAVFAQASYDLTGAGVRGLSITAGGRYTWEHITLKHLAGSTNRNGEFQSLKFDRPSWEFGLEYQASPRLLTYIKTRGSWRSGGLNGNAAPIDAPASGNGDQFPSETVKDVEAGLKYAGTAMGRPASFNIAAYRMSIKNVQRFLVSNVVDPATNQSYSLAVTASVPSARVQGIEVDATFSPADWLSIGGGGAYTDAKFKDNAALLYGTNFLFGPYPDTPKISGSFFARVELPVSENLGTMSVRGDVYAQSGQWFSANGGSSAPDTKLPGYALVNLRYEWRDILQSGMTFSLLARNLLNEKYYVGGLAEGASFGLNGAAVGRPRMYGAELRFDF